jgi:hypothetical protein
MLKDSILPEMRNLNQAERSLFKDFRDLISKDPFPFSKFWGDFFRLGK